NWESYLCTLPKSIQLRYPNLISPDLDRLAQNAAGMDVSLPDGRVVLVRCNIADTGGYVISATDITALKNAERQTRQRTAAIENAQDGIGFADDSGRMLYANPSLARLFDEDEPNDILGRHWYRPYTKKPDATFTDTLKSVGNVKEVMAVKGTPLRHHEISLTRVKNVGTVLIVQDITDRLQAQQKQMEMDRTLEQARQREVVSELAAGIAHDFNNILAVINGSAVLMSTDNALHPDLTSHVDRIIRAGQSAAKLVNHMMDLGRTDTEDGVYDLKWAVDEALTLATASMAANVDLHPKIAKATYPVFGSANDAVQVLLNLLINANDALEGAAGEIHVSLDPILALPEKIAVGVLNKDLKYARITVRDTGHGMYPGVIERIFEPRFTTKGEKGSGVGLSTVASMLKRLGGGAHVSSTPGKGTQFDVYWPLSEADTQNQNVQNDVRVSLKGQMVLVVDDDEAVTDIMQTYLERLGAEVAVCHDPSVALEVLTEDPDDWDVLITDYDMPGLSGGDLVEAVRKVTPDIPIFVVTALARRLNDHRITNDAVNAVLAKPLNLSKLSEALAKVADKTA
ncbi:MAG: ATP-binding protein, partial [Planktomarina sp.]